MRCHHLELVGGTYSMLGRAWYLYHRSLCGVDLLDVGEETMTTVLLLIIALELAYMCWQMTDDWR